MCPFKKRIDPVSVRLSSHACDIAMLYERTNQLERYLATNTLPRIDKLEKILKNCNITVTVVEKK